MIKKSLTNLFLAIALVFAVGCAGAQPQPTTGKMHIKNNSHCLLFAVTVIEIVVDRDTGSYVMELEYAGWFPTGKEVDVELKIGHLYGINIEGYYFDKDNPMKATSLAGEQYKQGLFNGKDNPALVLNCIHSEPREL